MRDNKEVMKICLAALLLSMWVLPVHAQVKIIDSGSTNVPGMTMTLEKTGSRFMVEQRGGAKQAITMTKEMCDRFLSDLKAAEPLNVLPVRHCAKSVSFGTSIYVEQNGVRSPDLSCQQIDPRADALKKDASEMLKIAKGLTPPKHY